MGREALPAREAIDATGALGYSIVGNDGVDSIVGDTPSIRDC